MFGKGKKNSEVVEMRKSNDEIQGFIGDGVEFEGVLNFDGAMRIDGSFKGEIQTTGTLIVGEGARVEAQIRCAALILHGEVVGNIVATDRLEAIAPARITGDIEVPALVISEGVFFDGTAKVHVPGQMRIEREPKVTLAAEEDQLESKEGA